MSLLPQVMEHVAAGRLDPQQVTTRVVAWEDALETFLEPEIKLVVQRD